MSVELLHVDCMEYMAGLPDKAFDLAIVDPPYGIKEKSNRKILAKHRPCRQKNGTVLTVKKLKYKHGDWDKNPPTEYYFEELFRVSNHQIIWGINYFKIEVGKGRIIWDKCVPEGVSFNKYEYAYCSRIQREITFDYMWAGMMQAKSLGEPKTQQGNKKLNETRIHPTQKPVDLYRWLLKNYAKPGDRILDTHLGSGSSAIAAHQMGFDFVGMEIDKDYYDAACKRFKEQTMQGDLFRA